MKKKLYNTPVTDYVEVHLPSIMVLSQEVDEDDRGSSEDHNANENIGGSWENIWNMQ